MGYRANAKCTKCGKWMKVEASEWPTDEAEVICNDCWFESASPTEAEREELFLADAERDTYYDDDSA